jgi:N-terminal acetyltransferase B complex non-catalytic subunit
MFQQLSIASLQLAKVTSQSLHFQWTAISSLWYKESLEQLVSTLEYVQCLIPSSHENEDHCKGGDQKRDDGHHDMLNLLVQRILDMMELVDSGEISSRIATLRQKMAFLPRLAESLSSRMVFSSQQTSSSSSVGGSGGTSDSSSAVVVVSENDWDIYLESLLVQGKKSEALEVLKNIQCTPMIGDGGNDLHSTTTADGEDSQMHEIFDEETVLNHVGSMLRYTRRKKLERLAQLSHELGMFENAEGYYRELLRVFPDQWTYWKGLVKTSCERTNLKSSFARVSTGMDISVKEEKTVSIDKVGWQRCHSFAKEIASVVGTKERHILRGPHLILLELASLELRQTPSQSLTTDKVNQRARMIALLRDEICEYGNKFGSQASCCFADIRSYLHLLVHASASGGEIAETNNIPNDVLHLLEWANGTWKNAQSTDTDQINGGAHMEDESRERRKNLRSFIFAVQVVYSIASEMKDLTLHLLERFAPSVLQMVSEWKLSLLRLPSVAAKDGGQKEVLPGDEIVLLISQYLLFRASLQPLSSCDAATTLLLQSAGLLEDAMDHSPYNPHLKIAAISIYAKLNAVSRALTIFQDMGVKQIQLDSCSYLILPLLVRGGLYTSAIKLAASVLRLHGSTSKDVKTYSSKALQNGLVFKAKEMIEFQCGKMRRSLQLLYSKGLLLDMAPMMIPSDLENDSTAEAKQRSKSNPALLAAEKGFCGTENDVMRAEQLAIDAETHFNAPAIIYAPAEFTTVDKFVCSDNRDMTVNYFEILRHTIHWTQMEMVTASLRSGHVQGLVARSILAVEVANAPKKGKVTKPTEETSYRCQSLRYALIRAIEFGRGVKLDELDTVLWESCCHLCEVIIVVIYGSTSENSTCTTLEERDVLATSTINSMTQLVQSAREALNSCNSEVKSTEKKSVMGGRVCQLLPDYICPLFILLETTSRLFSLFGWGKRKRLTRAASGALALAALSLQGLISDMLNIIAQFRSVSTDIQALVETSTSSEFGLGTLQRVVREVVSARELTMDRVDPFLVQMRDRLQSYNDDL